MSVDGYGGDPRDSDGVLSLIICDFEMSEEPQVLQGERLKSLFKRLIEFVQHSRKRSFRESLEETSAGFGLADLVATTWKRITKIKLILLTNRTNRSRVDAVPAGMIDEIPVTYNIWDLPRIHRYVTSGRARDDADRGFRKGVRRFRAGIEGFVRRYAAGKLCRRHSGNPTRRDLRQVGNAFA